MDVLVDETLIFKRLLLGSPTPLNQFYAAYQTSFPHEDEREDFASMVWLLTVNENADIQNKFGPYQEIALAIYRSSTNEIVGGLWFGVVSGPEHIAAGFAASVQVYYLFLYKPWRKLLRRGEVLAEIRRYALAAFPPAPESTATDLALFFEANNPTQMSPEEIDEDFDNSESDPYRRYAGWLHLGARPLDFNYVQPALDPRKRPVHFLTLFYMGPGNDMPLPMLLRHLQVFISISVLKGQDAQKNGDYQAMVAGLRGRRSISFVPNNHPDLREILDNAAWRSRAAHKKPESVALLRPPPLPEGARRFLLSPKLCNGAYRLVYRLYHKLEHYHLLVTSLEAIVGIFASIASLVVVAHLAESVTSKSSVIASSVTKIDDLFVSMGGEHYDNYLLLFLSLYVGSRGIVQLRRSQLGHGFGALRRQVRRLDDGTADSIPRLTNWLKQQMGKRAAERETFGVMIQPGTSDNDRSNIQDFVAGQSAQIYSDQVWRKMDPAWQRWESNALAQWLSRFPDGLAGATYPGCPGRTFFSAIFPVVTPPRLTRLGLRDIEIDDRYARRLMGRGDAPIPLARPEQGPPTLLVARLLMTGRAAGAKRAAALEAQLCLVLTGLIHVALLLQRLANAGSLTAGLPRNTTILVVAANRHSADVLSWLGFQLLQRAAPHEESDSADAPGEANLGIYRMVVAPPNERTPAENRLLDLLTHLLTIIARPV